MNLAIFASGGGSNFQAIVDATVSGELDATVSVCVTNNAAAGVRKRASVHGIPSIVLDPAEFADEEAYVSAVLQSLSAHGVDFIALAGYMKMIPLGIVKQFAGRMVNIHPALLPAYGGKGMYGRRVHQAVLNDGEKISGATVHVVDEDYDTGPIVLQRTVPVLETDTPESLASRVLDIEHALYPAALRLFAEGRVRIVDRQVIVK